MFSGKNEWWYRHVMAAGVDAILVKGLTVCSDNRVQTHGVGEGGGRKKITTRGGGCVWKDGYHSLSMF